MFSLGSMLGLLQGNGREGSPLSSPTGKTKAAGLPVFTNENLLYGKKPNVTFCQAHLLAILEM